MALSLEASVSCFYLEYDIYKKFLILCGKSAFITDWVFWGFLVCFGYGFLPK